MFKKRNLKNSLSEKGAQKRNGAQPFESTQYQYDPCILQCIDASDFDAIYLELFRGKIYMYRYFLHHKHRIHPLHRKKFTVNSRTEAQISNLYSNNRMFHKILSNFSPYQTNNFPKQLQLCWVKSQELQK